MHASLVPRFLPAFQCCIMKNVRHLEADKAILGKYPWVFNTTHNFSPHACLSGIKIAYICMETATLTP